MNTLNHNWNEKDVFSQICSLFVTFKMDILSHSVDPHLNLWQHYSHSKKEWCKCFEPTNLLISLINTHSKTVAWSIIVMNQRQKAGEKKANFRGKHTYLGNLHSSKIIRQMQCIGENFCSCFFINMKDRFCQEKMLLSFNHFSSSQISQQSAHSFFLGLINLLMIFFSEESLIVLLVQVACQLQDVKRTKNALLGMEVK